MQNLFNPPAVGMTSGEITPNTYQIPDMHYVYYDLKQSTDVIFLGKLSSATRPENTYCAQKIGWSQIHISFLGNPRLADYIPLIKKLTVSG